MTLRFAGLAAARFTKGAGGWCAGPGDDDEDGETPIGDPDEDDWEGEDWDEDDDEEPLRAAPASPRVVPSRRRSLRPG